MLDKGRQGPIGISEAPPDRIDDGVKCQEQPIGGVADPGQPFGVCDHDIELVALGDQESPAIGGGVHDLIDDPDVAEGQTDELAGAFIVVAGVDHLAAVAGLARQLPDDIIVGLGPMPVLLQAPAIENVTDQMEGLAFSALQKVEGHLHLSGPRAKMNVRYPNRPEVYRVIGMLHPKNSTTLYDARM